ncbi:MAG: ferritin family protein [Candidatus Krumholzibacteriia bacterium]
MVDRNLTTLEAVALAVRSEMESTHLYEELTGRVRNPAVIDVLKKMAADEEEHRTALMNLYQEMLGGEAPSIPERDGRDKELDLDPDADYLAVITAARDKELASETFYKQAAERVVDYKTRMFFIELAETERRHASTLQKQVDKLREDPHWFDREEADPYRSVHEGP